MKQDTSHDLDLQTVFQSMGADAEMEAMAIVTLLQASGIPAVLVGSASIPAFPFEVKVPKDHVEEAKRRIEEARAAGAAADGAEAAPLERIPGLVRVTIPILPSLSIDETLAFCRQIGFEGLRNSDEYAI